MNAKIKGGEETDKERRRREKKDPATKYVLIVNIHNLNAGMSCYFAIFIKIFEIFISAVFCG